MATEPAYTVAARAAIRDAHATGGDVAEWLAMVLANVAAELGSTEALLSGRSGSWEAGHVRDLLAGTVGPEDEYLDQHRVSEQPPLSLDLSTEVRKRLRHEPGCTGGGFTFETVESVDEPGVILVTADCSGCDACLVAEELRIASTGPGRQDSGQPPPE